MRGRSRGVCSRRSSGSNVHSTSSSSSSDLHSTYGSSSASRRTRPDRRPSLEKRGVPGEHPPPLSISVILEAVRFFWRHRAIGSWRSDLVFAPLPVPVSIYCAGVDECAGYSRAWRIGAVPAFRGLLPGGMSGFGAEFVAVDEGEKWCQANLSVPEAADMTAVDAVTVLDLGSGITTTYLLGSRTSCKQRFLMYKLWSLRHTRGSSSWQMAGCSRSRKKNAQCGWRCIPAGVRSPWIRFFSPSCRGKTMLSFSVSQR